MTVFEQDFQLRSPAEPEFHLVPPQLEHTVTAEIAREQLDFGELFGAVALFSVNRYGQSDIADREAA